ncbi:4Fe-4S dicluster domain-containing protein [Abyssisolibacter fermentans]|uniref:4Fe-4S dicluster domain-containing protein n=1 Tax=Abyssisolibacter fermentans TaxID=1766203 RepID=UPI000830A4E3|nr:4Fe-4S dicluster domain-containing protein [Abyssisolibacter fermentans]
MYNFESEIEKLKFQVLKKVAILAKDDRLSTDEFIRLAHEIVPGRKPLYRCCVYHERAILKERAKLASGFIPNGDSAEGLVKPDCDGEIMYIIEAACDRCPINKFTITEACRGCIQHKCMEVCPVNAITRLNGRAYINQDLCIECGRCKEVCPFNAISEVMRPCKKVCPVDAIEVDAQDRRAAINNDKCISCGACMDGCPFGAISDKSYIVSVVNKLKAKKKVYAVIAPAIIGQYGNDVTIGQVKTALKKVGFEDVIEAALGADAVTIHETMELIERMEKGDLYMTSSCCPAFVAYIKDKFPTEVDKISSTVSPMIAAGRLIKKEHEDAVVVFIGPCTAKKDEMKEQKQRDIDYVLTFEELTALMAAYDIDVEKCEETEVDDASSLGRNFAQSGGLTEAIQNVINEKGVNIEFKPIKISGAQNIRKCMTLAKIGKLPGNFIEGMMCEGGCIGGMASMRDAKKTKPCLTKFSKASNKQSIMLNEKLKVFEDIELEK